MEGAEKQYGKLADITEWCTQAQEMEFQYPADSDVWHKVAFKWPTHEDRMRVLDAVAVTVTDKGRTDYLQARMIAELKAMVITIDGEKVDWGKMPYPVTKYLISLFFPDEAQLVLLTTSLGWDMEKYLSDKLGMLSRN
jgi:hypothetical protein